MSRRNRLNDGARVDQGICATCRCCSKGRETVQREATQFQRKQCNVQVTANQTTLHQVSLFHGTPLSKQNYPISSDTHIHEHRKRERERERERCTCRSHREHAALVRRYTFGSVVENNLAAVNSMQSLYGGAFVDLPTFEFPTGPRRFDGNFRKRTRNGDRNL